MTVTEPLVHSPTEPWTIDDLKALPDDGMRYELVDGSLLVSPHSNVRHGRITNRLRRMLDARTPDDLEAGQDIGVATSDRRTYFVPDLFVARHEALEAAEDYLAPTDIVLVVEVLSPSNSGRDLVLKRHYYAAGGIPHYWIVDPTAQTLTALRLDGDTYVVAAIATPDEPFETDEPFKLTLNLGDIL